MFIFKNAIHNKDLFSAIVPVGVEISLGRPLNQCGATALLHEWHHSESRNHALVPSGCVSVNDFSVHLIWPKVSQLHEKHAARLTERRMRRTRRIHQVRPCRVMTRLITEHTF